MFKGLIQKKPAKDQRERGLLLGLVDLYLKEGKPIGSNTLKENGFDGLSSATIRNYFVKLERQGFLNQQHSSGGRIPTQKAFKLYAETHLPTSIIHEKDKQWLMEKLGVERKDPARYLQQAAEWVSELSKCAVLISAPRFDQDFILDIKVVGLDAYRFLCVVITDFGVVRSEMLIHDKKLSSFMLKRLEAYFHFRITGLDKPSMNEVEERVAAAFYKELMLRHIVSYSNFSSEDLFRVGFSQLLNYRDFNDAQALASGLSFFENTQEMKHLLSECRESSDLSCWIGEDLAHFTKSASGCAVLAIPYYIHQNPAGAIALLGPHRIPYRKLFGVLKSASDLISAYLTSSLYKFKITYRQPSAHAHQLDNRSGYMLIEDQQPQGNL